MDLTEPATTAAAAEWYSLGPSRSAKRALFSAAAVNGRRPAPLDRDERATTSPDPRGGPPNYWQRDDWVVRTTHAAGPQFNRSMSMRVRRSTRHHATAINGNDDFDFSPETSCHTSVSGVPENTFFHY